MLSVTNRELNSSIEVWTEAGNKFLANLATVQRGKDRNVVYLQSTERSDSCQNNQNPKRYQTDSQNPFLLTGKTLNESSSVFIANFLI